MRLLRLYVMAERIIIMILYIVVGINKSDTKIKSSSLHVFHLCYTNPAYGSENKPIYLLFSAILLFLYLPKKPKI